MRLSTIGGAGRLIAACVWVLMAGLGAARAAEPSLPDFIKSQGVLKVGVKCDYPPSGFLDEKGKFAGIEVEMAKRIAEIAFGSPDKAELQCVTSEARIPTLNAKKVDLIIATLGIYPERQKVIDFTTPYCWGASGVIQLKSGAAKSLVDFKGKTISVLKGASQAVWLEKNMPDVQTLRLNTVAEALQAMRQGRADGYAGDTSVLFPILSANKDLAILPEQEVFDVAFIGAGVRKNEPEWKAWLDAQLGKLRDEKFYSKVVPTVVSDVMVRDETIKFYESDAPKK
ncbi:transporter substrate-binding domain-containing protein [Bradyrhizobium liaoningense]|uniref:transporter substrate-binding domain-containing protein n=1 Tax=Bradyrhizobium liaoningense TaxID=43992 RepID=UPI001BAABB41|nr:transporter substrate-binding domain-containing protein [Bradyrhizobium liaoningense]MBR0706418.1 transporter substrate-binding domain-containing protein [Bradyrhizobium liaoningense]